MKFINKMKKNQKGFTLVEIIVVLVILAILAAFTIPTMLGFVDEAKGKAYIAEARTVYVAAQATVTELTAMAKTVDNKIKSEVATETDAVKRIKGYLGADATGAWEVTQENGKVKSIEYIKDGYTVTITAGGNTTVIKTPTTK